MRLRAILYLVPFMASIAAPVQADLMDEVKSRLQVHADQRGEFLQEKTVASLTKPLNAQGRFVYLTEQGLLWSIEKPYASDTVISGTSLLQSVNGRVILRANASSQPGYSAVSRVFMALISTDWQILEKDFRITGRIDGPEWQLVLIPKGGLFARFAYRLTLRGSASLQQIDIEEKNGDRTRYHFLNVRSAGLLCPAEKSMFAKH
jgi:hypothetical protein